MCRFPKLVVVLLISTLSFPLQSGAAAQQRTRTLAVSESKVLDDVIERKKQQPAITPAELARYANELIEKRGFDYYFDVCDLLTKRDHKLTASSLPARQQVSRTGGGRLILKFDVLNPNESLCGECWALIPVRQATKRELVLVADGKRYRVRRPASLFLEEAVLVDATMKKTLRRWQMPFQGVPVGISADGTKLYLDFYVGLGLEGLVAELSEDGTLAVRDRAEVQLQGEGKWIEDHPKDPNNSYLSFMRFQVGNKNYIVRFWAPCT